MCTPIIYIIHSCILITQVRPRYLINFYQYGYINNIIMVEQKDSIDRLIAFSEG